MTFRPLARLVAAASIASLAVLVTACATDDPDTTPSQGVGPSAEASTPPSLAPEEPDAPEALAATCENIISAATMQQFTEAGWTVKQHDFMIGETHLEGALCVWGDYAGPGSDNVAIFGWSPLTRAQASEAQNELIDAGWIREDVGRDVYITENPDYAIAVDEEGYGMTYLFGDGWVSVADSKQSLQLVNAPAE